MLYQPEAGGAAMDVIAKYFKGGAPLATAPGDVGRGKPIGRPLMAYTRGLWIA